MSTPPPGKPVKPKSDTVVGTVPPAAEDANPHKPADDREEIYFEGSPMLRGELGSFSLHVLIGLVVFTFPWMTGWMIGWGPWWWWLACILAGMAVIAAPWLLTKTLRYRITNYRIDFERGILFKRIDTLELWHVEDISFTQGPLDRIVGVGTITIESHDDTTPALKMKGIPNARKTFESLKQRIIAVKRQRGVLKVDTGM